MSEMLSDQLSQSFVEFIHAFGVLRTDATPCGQPMSVSAAHALCELAAGPVGHQRDLAERLGLAPSTVSRLVDQLVKRGWVERRPDPDTSDARLRLVELTSSGERVATQVLAARSERFQRLLEAVPPDQRKGVIDALQTLKEATDAIT